MILILTLFHMERYICILAENNLEQYNASGKKEQEAK